MQIRIIVDDVMYATSGTVQHRRVQIFDLVRPPERGGLKPPEIIHYTRKGSIAEPFLFYNPLDMTALAVPDHTWPRRISQTGTIPSIG